MYSIPVYSLRFAAHCRSRLKYLDLGAHDVAGGSAASGAVRFWIRFAPHESRVRLSGQCVTRAQSGARMKEGGYRAENQRE